MPDHEEGDLLLCAREDDDLLLQETGLRVLEMNGSLVSFSSAASLVVLVVKERCLNFCSFCQVVGLMINAILTNPSICRKEFCK